MITQVTDDMIGKKVTCKIEGTIINDAKIQKNGAKYYICQNIKNGSLAKDLLSYNYSWSIETGSSINLKKNHITDLKLVSELLPIFN